MSILTKNGANVNCKNNVSGLSVLIKLTISLQHGDTPLYIATENDNENIVSILIEKGADVNHKTNVSNL